MSSPVAEAEAGSEAGAETGQAGIRAWFGVLVGIAAWTVHIVTLSSLVEFTCERPEVEVVLHVLTAATTGVTLLGMWWCLALVRGSRDPDAAGTRGGRLLFLGLFGLMMGAFSVLLILWEGSYVLFLDPCA
ncbi:MAG TPA: hypothetical protein VK975_06155 [Acidimicrobiales bacterium]|nr:hypothetical protein [Acidimicrobiales bacterium]